MVLDEVRHALSALQAGKAGSEGILNKTLHFDAVGRAIHADSLMETLRYPGRDR